MDPTALLTVKMAMVLHIATEAGGGPIDIDLLDQTASHEGIQRVVNRRHGDLRHLRLRPQIDFVCGGMIRLGT
tara:strand:- start:1751 stop:1969 length:219 start_codon:yes stop_codon:yes gene_type:complete